MISKLQEHILKLINENFNNYGFDITFKYDQRVETIDQYRKNFAYHKKNYLNEIIDSQENIDNFLFGVFKRDVIQREKEVGRNNVKIELEHNTDKYKILKFRGSFFGHLTFTFNVITNDIKQGDLFELIYEYEFPQTSYLDITYNFGDDFEPLEVGYNLEFSDLSLDDFENTFGRLYEFTIDVKGLFFLPYTYDENLALLKIDEFLSIQNMESNNTASKLIEHQDYIQEKDKYIVDKNIKDDKWS